MNPLEEFLQTYRVKKKEIPVIPAADLAGLKYTGHTAEDLFNYIINRDNLLLHGSREDISGPDLKPNGEGKIFATDLASIAIMRAIISNKDLKYPGLEYAYFIGDECPLEVKIYGMNENTIGSRGFVYVIAGKDKRGFENNPKDSWQYVKEDSPVPFIVKFEVLREDFTSPVFDVDKDKQIQ